MTVIKKRRYLTSEDRSKIVSLSLAGRNQQQIAAQTRISSKSVSRTLIQRKKIIEAAEQGIIIPANVDPKEIISERTTINAKRFEELGYSKAAELLKKELTRGPRGPYKKKVITTEAQPDNEVKVEQLSSQEEPINQESDKVLETMTVIYNGLIVNLRRDSLSNVTLHMNNGSINISTQ